MEATIIHSRSSVQTSTDALGRTRSVQSIEVEAEPAIKLIPESGGNYPDNLGCYIDTMA